MNNEIAVKEQNAMQPQNMTELMEISKMLSTSDFVPANFQGKPGDISAAIMTGREIGLSAMQSLRNIAVINGRASLWGDAMMALVQSSPVFGGIEELFNNTEMTATCTVWRKGGERKTYTFSEEDATVAGLWGKVGPWSTYPKRMLQMRARGFAIRDNFSDCLAGMIAREEAYDTPPPETKQITAEIIGVSEQIALATSTKELMDIYQNLTTSKQDEYRDELNDKREDIKNQNEAQKDDNNE